MASRHHSFIILPEDVLYWRYSNCQSVVTLAISIEIVNFFSVALKDSNIVSMLHNPQILWKPVKGSTQLAKTVKCFMESTNM